MHLTDREKEELKRLIDAGDPLPAKYKLRLFADAPEVELIWQGKTSEVTSVVLPFQSIEQIDEPRQAAGGLKLVYIDPPFDVGADFSVNLEVGEETLTKEPSVIEELAYRDTWGKGTDSRRNCELLSGQTKQNRAVEAASGAQLRLANRRN